jgi:hypothetical protein
LQPATLLAGIVYYLVTNPEIYTQAVTEVRTMFQDDEDIRSTELARLEYLNAVIRETMRIFPVAGDVLPRLIPKGGETILGDWLPEGVSNSPGRYETMLTTLPRLTSPSVPTQHPDPPGTSPSPRLSTQHDGSGTTVFPRTRTRRLLDLSDKAIEAAWDKCGFSHPTSWTALCCC